MGFLFSSSFDKHVVRFFGPLAKQAHLQLRKVKEGIYEICGRSFVLRIRRGTGHRNDFLVTLSSKSDERGDIDDLSKEIGLGVIAEFSGRPLRERELRTEEETALAFEEAAASTAAFCLPYLLDLRSDLNALWEFIERKIETSGVRNKKYKFPHNVREEWTD